MARRWLCLAPALFALIACGSPANNATELPVQVEHPQAVVGVGWENLITITHGTEIKIDITGHYNVERGSCTRQREIGQIQQLSLANAFMENANKAVAKPLLSQEYCFSAEQFTHVGSYVHVEFSRNNLKPLYIRRGSEICTGIQDQRAARDLLPAMEQVLQLALKEGCPR